MTVGMRSNLRRSGLYASAALAASGAAASGLIGLHPAGANEAGNDSSNESSKAIPPSNLQTCAPDFGGTKVPYTTQGFFGDISMTQQNVVRPGQRVELKFRIISTDNNCVISNPAAVSAITITPTTPPGAPQVTGAKADDDDTLRFDARRQIFIHSFTVPNGPAGAFTATQIFYNQTYYAHLTASFLTKGR